MNELEEIVKNSELTENPTNTHFDHSGYIRGSWTSYFRFAFNSKLAAFVDLYIEEGSFDPGV